MTPQHRPSMWSGQHLHPHPVRVEDKPVQIDVRATERMRAKTPIDLGAILSPVTAAARDSSVDLTRLRIVCDWLQYRQNFRNVVDVRHIIPFALQAKDGVDVYELAVDMRRAAAAEDLGAQVTQALNEAAAGEDANGHHYLEDWRPGSQSVIWDFNG